MPAPHDIDRMLHPHEAHDIIAAAITSLPAEDVPLQRAFGRILAEDMIATAPYPPFAASTMDGYAVLAADASPWREVIGTQNAGDVLQLEVTEGYCIRIMTGAPLPPGADAVVPVEATEMADDHVVIHQEDVAPGQNIRPVGVDIAAGELLVTAGTRIGAAEVGLLASLGHTPVKVTRKLRISIISTGDELVEPEQTPGPGQIRDANRFTISAMLATEPVEITWIGIAPDNRPELEALLAERLANDDLVLTSGGVSMGEKDYIKAILFEDDDVELYFRRLYMKPGKPLTFARKGRAFIFGLPGNPVSSMATFDVFVRPAIHRMIGARQVGLAKATVKLLEAAEPGDRIEYQRGTVHVTSSGELEAIPTGDQRSSRLASYINANAYLVIQPRESPYNAGEHIDALLTAAPTLEG
jgi:molybdenum cofactor synthesis domain-containing protein